MLLLLASFPAALPRLARLGTTSHLSARRAGMMLALCGVLAIMSAPAHANCSEDLTDIRGRVDALKHTNIPRYALANRWWVLAEEASPNDEVECINLYAKVRKALIDPIPQVNNCIGPNTILPNCQNEGATRALGTGAGDFTVGGIGVGSGGGAAGPAQFMPPGSVGTAAGTASPP